MKNSSVKDRKIRGQLPVFEIIKTVTTNGLRAFLKGEKNENIFQGFEKYKAGDVYLFFIKRKTKNRIWRE